MSTPEPIGRVIALAIKTSEGGPMREVESVSAATDGCLAGDVPYTPDRGTTLISKPQWDEIVAELGANLPWHTRRANVLVDIERLEPLIGRRLRIGPVEIDVRGETKPCGIMDKLHQGLRDALKPECRGGVFGRIQNDGEIRIGDTIELLPAATD